MSLRRKSLLILGGTMVALFVVIVIIAQTILAESYSALEERETTTQVERALAVVDGRVSVLETVAGDWAPWDDTYQFLLDGNEAYVASNLNAETLDNLGLDFMLFVRNSGEIVQFAAYDPSSGEPVDPPPYIGDLAGAGDLLLDHPDEDSSVTGLVMTTDGPLMVASRPILTSDYKGPINGSLVVGRILDEDEVAALEASTRLTIDLAVPGEGAAPAADGNVQARLDQGDKIVVRPRDENHVSGYSVLSDLYGEPAVVLGVTTDRAIHQGGQRATWYVTFAVIALGTVFLLVFWQILERLFLSRLSRLSSRVEDIGREGDSAARVVEDGADEIGSLSAEINTMLQVMEESEADLCRARDELESRVLERTAELAATNTSLTHEIDERRETEKALHSSEERLRELMENMADAVFTLDPEGAVTFVNPEAARLTGYPVETLAGMHFSSLVSSESLLAVERQLLAADSTSIAGTREIVVTTRDGVSVPVELGISPLVDRAGRLSGVQWIARDVSERKRFEAQLVHTANHDFLTGLMNRRGFEVELERNLSHARRRGFQGSILWLDLDDFKAVNDSLGHRAGDALLVDLATRLSGELREYDILARLGGDEFALLLPQTQDGEADLVARRIVASICDEPFSVEGHTIRTAVSIGIVTFPDHGLTVEELLSRADVAMYHAKAEDCGICVYEPQAAWNAEVGSRLTWAERIETALQNDALVVYAQPIYDVVGKSVHSYELLVRLRDEDGTILPPGAFLHHAERAGLIRNIDRWMVKRAVDLIAEQLQRGRRVRLDVNLSPKAFTDPRMLATVREALAESGIPPALLGIEITETAAATDLVRAQSFIESLRQLGCRFALDDFGVGFSSFYHLKHLAVDTIKIDGGFVRDLPRSREDQHLVKAIIELARGLELESVAEFVEDAETFQMLGEYGADRAQGYHLAVPRPVEEVLEALGSHERSAECAAEYSSVG